ncbi:MAG: sialidase family protein [Thermoplasmatota archaeon]
MRGDHSVGIALGIVAALLAGCIGSAPTVPSLAAAAGVAQAQVAQGCDATRAAWAFGDDGARASSDAVEHSTVIPCFFPTGQNGSFEPTLGVDPKTGDVFFFPTRSATAGDLASALEVARSADGGRTWSIVGPTLGSEPSHPTTFDPYFYLDPATGRIFADDDVTTNCAQISFSDDLGATWTNSVTGCTTLDHQTIFAGKPVSSMTIGYPRVVYRCSYEASGDGVGLTSSCLKSLDGGLAWIPTGAPTFGPALGAGNVGMPTCDPALGHGAAGPDGTIYLPSGLCGVPVLAVSHDEGATWTTVRVSDHGEPLTAYGMYGHEAGVGADRAGNVYYGWIGQDRRPYVTISRDEGKTWGAPLALAVPGVREASLPELIVGGVGKFAMVYMGSRNAPPAANSTAPCAGTGEAACLETAVCPMFGACIGAHPVPPAYRNVTWNGYIVETTNALAPHPTFVGTSVNDPSRPLARGDCDPNGCQAENDFLDIRLGPDGSPWAAFVDGCVQACLRDGGQDDASEGAVGHLAGGPSLFDTNASQ